MLIFRLISSIIFAPIRLLANLFHPRNNLLEWHMIYGSSSVFIQTKTKEHAINDNLLIASYILFLGRYFYICDDRQIDLVRSLLIQEIERNNNKDELPIKIYYATHETLYEQEQKVVQELFSNGLPPLKYSIKEEPLHSYAKYSYFVYKHRGKLAEYFNLSHGPDIILLPVTVAILYCYVIDNLLQNNNKNKLDSSIIDLLNSYSSYDCRSLQALVNLPSEVLVRNKITY